MKVLREPQLSTFHAQRSKTFEQLLTLTTFIIYLFLQLFLQGHLDHWIILDFVRQNKRLIKFNSFKSKLRILKFI
jgi:hypothetical protein